MEILADSVSKEDSSWLTDGHILATSMSSCARSEGEITLECLLTRTLI